MTSVAGGRYHALVQWLWPHGVIVVVALLSLVPRLVWLWPPSAAVMQQPYDDEGVYVMAARLLWQGAWPYRDFFFAHPPLGLVTLLPATALSPTPWGSALGMGLGRLTMAALGAVTVGLVGAGAARIWGPAGGLIASLVLAVDLASVVNSRHVMLEVPVTLLATAALVAGSGPRTPSAGLRAGVLAGLASLVKIQGGVVAVALAAEAVRRRDGRWLLGLAFGGGLALAALVPFMAVAGPDRFLREVVLFQLARPDDGLVGVGARLAAIAAPSGLGVSLAAALLGLSVGLLARAPRPAVGWQPAALWLGLGLVSFLAARSFYPHYLSQLAPAAAVLAGGLARALALPGWQGLAGRAVVAAVVGGSAVVLAPALEPRPDTMFATVARYVTDAVPPDGAVAATDAQFNALAARPTTRTDGGYLVDSYGQLLFTGLGLDRGELIAAGQQALRERGTAATVDEVVWRPAAQALLREHMAAAQVVVVHAVGRRRLTPESRDWLLREFRVAESTARYEIYRRVR